MTKQPRPQSKFEDLAIRFTTWIGSTSSVLVHSCIFALAIALLFSPLDFNKVLLVFNTGVSLEAIYLAIFIQMTVNRNTQSLEEVEEDIDEIQKDVDEIQEDVGEIEKDVDEIQKDVDEVQKDIDEVQEDVEDISEGETAEQQRDRHTRESLDKIEVTLARLIDEIEKIKHGK